MRHEEAGAFAAGAQAQLTGTLGVCMGTVGPGSIHLLNGLYDAKKSHAPVLAICGQVPLRRASAATSSRRSTTTRCSPTWPCFCQTVTSAGADAAAAGAGGQRRSRRAAASRC